MAEEVLNELIKRAEMLTTDEQMRLSAHLAGVQQLEPEEIWRQRWSEIQAHQQEILAVAAKYGAGQVRVFSLGEQEGGVRDIEVNFLVNLERGRSLLDQSGLMVELRELLGFELYVFTEAGLGERYREKILQKAIAL
ncbi:hypothetical protein [[Phormidium] sp. ETS-05]|uniref:hypothetical protein n=1 Tax=[Phormidium] sp. ETS-05 TaxID=222819 RepID=UPI0018EEF393|nr:hypothetical protein [[Phormidium] sp. ETS-05]